MKKTTAERTGLLLLGFLVIGCGRPEIQIDSTIQREGLGSAPVGLLEVHRANSGNAMGLSIGESLGESRYCSAVLLQDGRILTSVGCLSDQNGAYPTDKLEFHLNWTGGATEHWKIAHTEASASLAYLHPVTAGPEGLASASSAAASDLPLDEKTTSAPALSASVTSPDKHGHARSAVYPLRVDYNPAGFGVTYTDTSTSTSTNTNTTPGGAPGIGLPPAISTDTRTQVTTEVSIFRAVGLKTESIGSPVFVGGKVVGVAQNPAGRSGLDIVSWIDARSRQAPQPQPIPPAQPGPNQPEPAAPGQPLPPQ